jgi:hypothetical protein
MSAWSDWMPISTCNHYRAMFSQNPFVTFIEHNDNESETWKFYFQYNDDDQEDCLDKLADAIKDINSYELDLTIIPEYEVDILVKHSVSGYMAAHQKLYGSRFAFEKFQRALKEKAIEKIGNWLRCKYGRASKNIF